MKFSFLLPNIEISGGNRANFELANALVALGHDVEIFYPLVPGRDGLGWWQVRKTLVQLVKGTRNLLFRKHWFALKAGLTPLLTFSARRLNDELPAADYVIASWWAHVELLQQLNAKAGKPVHLIRSLEFWGGPVALVTAAYQADMIKIVTSDSLRKQYERQFGPADGVVSDGVSTALFSPAPHASEANENRPVTIGMMYRRQPLKRMQDGFTALAAITREAPDVRVKLFGERIKASDRAAIKQVANCEHVLFPTGEDLRDLYRQVDVFLFPSGPEEAFGLPPLEAMACGCAVVSSDVGAVTEYSVHGETALHFAPGDINTMVAHLRSLLADGEKRHAMGQAAVLQAQKFDWQGSARRLLETLDASVG